MAFSVSSLVYFFLFCLVTFVVLHFLSGPSDESVAEKYVSASGAYEIQKWDLDDPMLADNPTLREEYAMINALIDKTSSLVKYLAEKKPSDARTLSLLKKWRGGIERLDYRATKDAAVTYDKISIHMCLRNKDTGALHDIDTAMFVLIHELAHMVTEDIGHTSDFWENMKYLLDNAEKAVDNNGQPVFKRKDFKNSPEMYCGVAIKHDPRNAR